MQHENGLSELDCVDGTIGATCIVLYDLENTGAAEAFEYLGGIVLIAPLSERQGVAEQAPHI